MMGIPLMNNIEKVFGLKEMMMNPNKEELFELKLREAIGYAFREGIRKEEIVNSLIKYTIVLTDKWYLEFTPDMKMLSDNDWKEWIRNQVEGSIATHKAAKEGWLK